MPTNNISAILEDELAEAQRAYRKTISGVVAKLGNGGNRLSTSVVSAMHREANDELTRRIETILESAVRHSPPGLVPTEIPAIISVGLKVFDQQVELIKVAVVSVNMGSTPSPADFLDERAPQARRRFEAELKSRLEHKAHANQVLVLKPELWGLSVNLKVALRRVARWFKFRKSGSR